MLFAKFEIKTLLSCWFFDDVRKPQCSCSKTCQTEARSASLQCYRISYSVYLTGGGGVPHRSVKVTPPTKQRFFSLFLQVMHLLIRFTTQELALANQTYFYDEFFNSKKTRSSLKRGNSAMAGPNEPGWERERFVHGAGRIVYDTSKYANLTLLTSYASIEDAVEERKNVFCDSCKVQ